jgi:hypothetical protein
MNAQKNVNKNDPKSWTKFASQMFEESARHLSLFVFKNTAVIVERKITTCTVVTILTMRMENPMGVNANGVSSVPRDGGGICPR